MDRVFTIARNPQEDSRLPYLLRLPLEGGVVLKARDTWPRSSRVYCHPYEAAWPDNAEVVEETPVVSCRRRGAVIDLVLDRPRLNRSQFVLTEARGRPAIFWQTRKAARAANPGARIPRARALPEAFTIAIDTRERYPYRFTGRGVTTERLALPAGDYAVVAEGDPTAAAERKTLENLASSLSDGTMAFQMQRLAETPSAAVVVEGRYPQLFGLEHVSGAWLADMLARLRFATPRCRSCSPTPDGSRRSGPTASSQPPSPRHRPNPRTADTLADGSRPTVRRATRLGPPRVRAR